MRKIRLTCDFCNNEFAIIHSSEDIVEHCVFCSSKIEMPKEKIVKENDDYEEEEEENIRDLGIDIDEDDMFDEY